MYKKEKRFDVIRSFTRYHKFPIFLRPGLSRVHVDTAFSPTLYKKKNKTETLNPQIIPIFQTLKTPGKLCGFHLEYYTGKGSDLGPIIPRNNSFKFFTGIKITMGEFI